MQPQYSIYSSFCVFLFIHSLFFPIGSSPCRSSRSLAAAATILYHITHAHRIASKLTRELPYHSSIRGHGQRIHHKLDYGNTAYKRVYLVLLLYYCVLYVIYYQLNPHRSSRTYESTACDSNTNSINAGRSSVESAERLRFCTCHKSSRKNSSLQRK